MLLAIETASSKGSVALFYPDGSAKEVELPNPRNHGATLASVVAELIKEHKNDISGYAVDVGPGSFTGLRIAVAFLKGLAFALPRPVAPVCSLEVIAAECFDNGDATAQVISVLKASGGQVFAAVYEKVDGQLSQRQPPQLTTIKQVETWAAEYSNSVIAGEELKLLADKTRVILPKAIWVARIGAARLDSGKSIPSCDLSPAYYQLSAAELNISGPIEYDPPHQLNTDVDV